MESKDIFKQFTVKIICKKYTHTKFGRSLNFVHVFSLFKLVNEEGGFDAVCRERRWTRISVKMGFAPGKAVGSHLRAHYERILYPYNLFQTGANLPVCPITRVFSFPTRAAVVVHS